MKRREFLILTAGFSLSLAVQAHSKLPKLAIEINPATGFDADQWQTIDLLLNHLFPSEPDAPGAKDVFATAWLHNALLAKDIAPGHREQLQDGLQNLENTSHKLFKKPFVLLPEPQREHVLQKIAETRSGKIWIREIMRYVFEALLTAPVYGGNPKQIGWKWLKHQPGFPLPPANKRYFLL